MGNCNLCERAIEMMPSLVGKNFESTRTMFVLHKPDRRVEEVLFRDNPDKIYEMALRASKTGSEVERLLEYCGMTMEDVLITNLIKCTLRNDAKPTKQEYQNCLRNLGFQIDAHKPRKIVGFGSAVYETLFPGKGKVSDSTGDVMEYRGVPTLVMMHPSRIWSFLDPLRKEREYEKVRRFL